MIWVERKSGSIIYYTSDGLIFNNICSAIIHIKNNTEILISLNESFDKNISRIKKIKKLINGI